MPCRKKEIRKSEVERNLSMIILTEKYIYSFKRKGIRFYLRILMCKIRKEKFEVVDY